MNRLKSLIRRHLRFSAGLALILIAAGAGFALDSAGSGPAQPARTGTGSAVARTSFRSFARFAPRAASAATASAATAPAATAPAPTAPAPTAGTASAAAATAPRLVASRSRSAHRGATSNSVRPGLATPAPSSRAVALALRQATGLSPSQVTTRELCPPAGADHARCAGEALVLRSNGEPVHPPVTPASSNSAPVAGTPAYLQQAYDLSYLSQNEGAGDTVAVVDAYDDPTAQSDLDKFRSNYGLPACDSGCFTKVNQQGATAPLPAASSEWAQEISLDLDAVSSICPNCHILLVEASSSGLQDMQAAMQTAGSTAGVKQISASWTMTASGQPAGQYTFPGIATVAATGDQGYVGPSVDNYPAALPGVTAAGGTTLAAATGASNLRGFSEAAWSGAGSGCDLAESKPTWQADTGCTGRSYADLSADADPDTGLNVVEDGSWVPVGGTSLATPLIAAYYAVTGVTNTSAQWAYGDSAELNDVTSGSNGSCAAGIAYICSAGTGYDGPTGVGSISGAAVTGAPGIGGPAIGAGNATTYTQSTAAHGATIAGGIYRNGLDTTWSIQYGTSDQYGSQTQPIDIGAGSAPVAVTGYLSGLTPATMYHYRLVAQNLAGTTYGYDYTFATPAAPVGTPTASFTASPAAPTPNSAVSFDASASTPSTGLTYSWNFGDGSTGSGETTTHSFTSRGTYPVTLTVTSGSTSDTSTQRITVDNPPTAAFTPSAPASNPTAVSFDSSASTAGAGAQITDYSWNFGDGTTADTGSSTAAAHTYASAGTYTVTLTTTDDLNVTDTVSQTVTVGTFTGAPSVPAPGAPVTFTPASTSGITSYSWNFGDPSSTDNTDTVADPTHTYAQPGQYTVTLTTTDGAGQTVTGTETVTVDDPPSADLPNAPIIATPDASVTFNGGSSAAASQESIRSYTWNFGDGTAAVTGSSPSATHVYSTPGRYTATLMVTDNLGVPATTAATQQVVVDEPAPAFTRSAVDLAPSATASFDASGSNDPEGTIADYSWNFGDGSSQDTGLTPSATHSYASRGVKTVTLTITNSYGQSASTTHTLTVDNPPTAALTASATAATTDASLEFSGAASAAMTGGSIADYSWSFGDGATADTGTTSSAAHAFSAPGTYTVTLTTTDDLGVSASASEQVTIQAPPAPSTQTTTSTQTPTSTPPAPAPAPSPTPAPSPAPVASPSPAPNLFTATLGAAKKQSLAPALAHGLRLSLSVNQGTRASFQITLPVRESRLAASAHKPNSSTIVLLRTRAQSLGGGAHAITLKLSKAAARELAARGPLVVTVKVTLSEAGGATVTRTVNITLAR